MASPAASANREPRTPAPLVLGHPNKPCKASKRHVQMSYRRKKSRKRTGQLHAEELVHLRSPYRGAWEAGW